MLPCSSEANELIFVILFSEANELINVALFSEVNELIIVYSSGLNNTSFYWLDLDFRFGALSDKILLVRIVETN